MGLFAVLVALLGLVGGFLFGIPSTLVGCVLLGRRKQSGRVVLRAWLEGAIPAGVLWATLSTWLTEFPDGHGPPQPEDWSSLFRAFAMWAVLPGAILFGGGIAQTVRAILRRQQQ